MEADNLLESICMNCVHFRDHIKNDSAIEFLHSSVCGVEGVEMDPNDTCNCFELPITKAMIEKYSLDNKVSLTIAALNLYGYGIV